jgi:hypothetical protein
MFKDSKSGHLYDPFRHVKTRISIPLPIYPYNLKADANMGRLYVILSDQVERRLRLEIVKRLGGKKGDLSTAIEESVKMWLDTPPGTRTT